MQIKPYLDNFIVIPISFGLGLAISGHYLQGLAAIAIGGFAYFKGQTRGLEKSSDPISSENLSSSSEIDDFLKRKNSETHQEEPPPLDNWYYAKDEEVVGPLLESEMLSLMKEEEITNETLVFNATLGDEWRVLEDTHFIKKNHHRGY
jgi:hypothetical protein